MAHGCRTLSIPVFEFLNAFQVKKSSQSSAVVINNSEILILDCTAHLWNVNTVISDILAEEHKKLASFLDLLIIRWPLLKLHWQTL